MKKILFLLVIFGVMINFISAAIVPSLSLQKDGSAYIPPKYNINAHSEFNTNSMTGNLIVVGNDSKKKQYNLQLTIMNTNVKETPSYITVEGNGFGVYWDLNNLTSIDWVPAKYIIYKPSNSVNVYLGKKLIVSNLRPPRSKSKETGMITHGGTPVTIIS